MNRFLLSRHAEQDIDEIAEYLESLPKSPALKLGYEVEEAIRHIAERPASGFRDRYLTALLGFEVRRWICGDYVILYATNRGRLLEIIAVLHGRRDILSIMRGRIE